MNLCPGLDLDYHVSFGTLPLCHQGDIIHLTQGINVNMAIAQAEDFVCIDA